jgi:hypothetical protein
VFWEWRVVAVVFLLLKYGEMRGKDGGWARNFPEAKILQVF